MADLLIISHKDTNNLKTKYEDGTYRDLNLGPKNSLRALRAWNALLVESAIERGPVYWSSLELINAESYTCFKESEYDPDTNEICLDPLGW